MLKNFLILFLSACLIFSCGKNKEEILNSFRQRITNNINLEFEEAKKQVKKIANFRLGEIIK